MTSVFTFPASLKITLKWRLTLGFSVYILPFPPSVLEVNYNNSVPLPALPHSFTDSLNKYELIKK